MAQDFHTPHRSTILGCFATRGSVANDEDGDELGDRPQCESAVNTCFQKLNVVEHNLHLPKKLVIL